MRRGRLGTWLLCAAFACAGAAPAQDGDEDGSDPVERLPSTIRGELPLSHLTVQGVVVGRDRLVDAERRLGPAMRFTPVGSVDVVAVCYEAGDALESVLVFQADPKDPEGIVLMAHATRRSALGGMARHCQPSPALSGGVRNSAGVSLGMAARDLIAWFLHPPSVHQSRYTGYYFYEPIEPRPDAGPRAECQLLSGIRIRTRDGESLAFSVYRFYRGKGC